VTRLLIVAHAPLASSLKAVAQHAYPDCASSLGALDVEPNQSPEDVERSLRPLVGDEETLILTDVFGATPCNGALRVADGLRVKVVCGLNVPMLWRCLCYGGQSVSALAGLAASGGSQGVMQLASSRPQNQAPAKGRTDDLSPRHDTQ
jgi:PTS system ascorbate-specific IIA component